MPLPNVDDVEPLHLAEDGPHEVEIFHAKEFDSKNDRTCLRYGLRVIDDEDADDIWPVPVFYPKDDDAPREYKKSAAKVTNFMECFGLSGGAADEDMIGARGNVITRQKTDKESGQPYVDVVKFE